MSACKLKASSVMRTIYQILIAEKPIIYFPSDFIGIKICPQTTLQNLLGQIPNSAS